VSHILQRIAADLLHGRNTQRLLARAEKTYRERREALLRELAKRGIAAHGVSGLNVWIPVAHESAVAQSLLGRGWAVNAGERYRIASGPAIRVTISKLEPRDAARFADDLYAVAISRANMPGV
jgi:DNA-binding transcriptional MocR family regulator